jgi:hypothetical protein
MWKLLDGRCGQRARKREHQPQKRVAWCLENRTNRKSPAACSGYSWPEVEGILLEFLGGRLLDWLPGWLARRFVSVDSVSRQVRLLPRSKTPLVFSLNEATPTVRAYFQVVNHSGVDLMLDRIVAEIWAGQPVAYGVMAHRVAIAKHATTDEIPAFQMPLTPKAIEGAERIREQQKANPGSQGNYTQIGTAFFDSKIGSFKVQLIGHEADVQA